MKTDALKQALDKYGAVRRGLRRCPPRRGEESRAKERDLLSFRDQFKHQWDPKNQRPELWNVSTTVGTTRASRIRVFPLSNWTELDVWQYIHLEDIPIVPLYYAAKERPVRRNATVPWIMVDDERMPPRGGRRAAPTKLVRFRTLGCYPLTGADRARRPTRIPKIVRRNASQPRPPLSVKVESSTRTKRPVRWKKKKREGYF